MTLRRFCLAAQVLSALWLLFWAVSLLHHLWSAGYFANRRAYQDTYYVVVHFGDGLSVSLRGAGVILVVATIVGWRVRR